MWNDRALPPSPDDSLYYSGHIYSVLRCPQIICNTSYVSLARSDGYIYLSYRIFWGLIAQLLHVGPLFMYKIIFYLGTLILIPTLIYFLFKLTSSKKLTAYGLFILTLYHGGGSYHGFFWVVPSFFALLLYFLILALLLERHSKSSLIALMLITPILVFTHPIGLFLLGTLPIYWATYAFLTSNFQKLLLYKIMTVVLLGITIYFAMPAITKTIILSSTINKDLASTSTFNNINSNISKELKKISTAPTKGTTSTSAATYIKNDYLKWLFPSRLGIIPFVFFIGITYYFKHFKLLALYITAMFFTAISSIHPFGFRALLLLWPATFLLYGYGFYFTFKYINSKPWPKKITTPLKTITAVALGGFIILNMAYSYSVADYINKDDNLSLSNNFVEYLLSTIQPNDSFQGFKSLTLPYLYNTKLVSYPQLNSIGQIKYYIFHDAKQQADKKSTLNTFLYITSLISGQKNPAANKFTEEPVKPITSPQPHELSTWKNLILEKQIDDIYIYRNVTYDNSL